MSNSQRPKFAMSPVCPVSRVAPLTGLRVDSRSISRRSLHEPSVVENARSLAVGAKQ